jgi:hypothetical protein
MFDLYSEKLCIAEAAARDHTHLTDERRLETVAVKDLTRLADVRPGVMRTFDPYAEESCISANVTKPEACHFDASGMRVFDLSGPSEDDDLRHFDRPRGRAASNSSTNSVPWLSPSTWWWFGKYWLSGHGYQREFDRIDCENAEVTEFVFRNGRIFEVKVGEEPSFWDSVKASLRV